MWKSDVKLSLGAAAQRLDGILTQADDHEPLIVWAPRSWLLREGWRRHGLIDWKEVPSDPRRRARNMQTRVVLEG